MKTVLRILQAAGGWHHGLSLCIENPPYMPLCIEAVDESGPCGLPALSVAHYGEQNGDAMRDPEMCFELGFAGGPHLNPFYWQRLRRNRAVGPLHHGWAVRLPSAVAQAAHRVRRDLGYNLRFQHFAEAFERQRP